MKRKIIEFHQDDENHWVADLECGHTIHMRHIPPMTDRQWTKSTTEREKRIGYLLECSDCSENLITS